MIKVRILDQCEFCDGEATVPAGEAESFIVMCDYLPVSFKKRLGLP